ncbi:hypothetical protein [Chitinimonas sp. BJB300]|uniref:hypothetical protein n=1 Tax=Chitinimonas sp. BJB300 TaxID=1559339 RepID=UPI001111F51F|nr:hypothetical protein [Chitinimonas sp. BJB300]TSJ90156.1 hypothetical protein FG002_008270 [Chitinimonas sp. BJB300]
MREIGGEAFSAKDFRTWAGTLLAVSALREVDASLPAQQQLSQAMTEVSAQLGNTVAVCKPCYVHPGCV